MINFNTFKINVIVPNDPNINLALIQTDLVKYIKTKFNNKMRRIIIISLTYFR
jgi:hypothetical protein